MREALNKPDARKSVSAPGRLLYAGYSVNELFAIFWKSAGYIWSISPVGVLVYLGLIVV